MGRTVTNALTLEMFSKLIDVISNGFKKNGTRERLEPNPKIAFILILQANLGLRIGDVLNLKLNDIVSDGDRYRLDIIEEKTKKERTFTVPTETYRYMMDYCLENGIRKTDRFVQITQRTVQRTVAKAAEHLGYKNISTHSFRKFFATSVYVDSGYNIALVQELLQHSDPKTTRKYIKIASKEIETALNRHKFLPKLKSK